MSSIDRRDQVEALIAAVSATGVVTDLELDVQNPGLQTLLDYWQEKRGDRPMPARADIDPLEFRGVLPQVLIAEVHHAPLRFRWRLIGTDVTKTLGRDQTGKWFADIYRGDVLTAFNAALELSVVMRRPIRFVGRGGFVAKEHMDYEGVHMPLSDDGETVNMILMAARFGVDTPGP